MNSQVLEKAVKLSIANVISDGLDDVLPRPFELNLLKENEDVRSSIQAQVIDKLSFYFSDPRKEAFENLGLEPLSYVLVPKKEAFDYRKVAIVVPEDLILYQAVTILIAEVFEKARLNVSKGRIFSYRFKPILSKGQLFRPSHNLRTFQSKTSEISNSNNYNYIVKSDISNFYDRINIHRLESTLLAQENLDNRVSDLINQILLHWARRDSYSIPTGSNASRILAEVALYNVDQSLVNEGIKFIRFVDDYRIFTRSAVEAHSALTLLIELLNREGLFINTRKSSISKFVQDARNEHSKKIKKDLAEKIDVKEFRIFAGYGGTIPIKFRSPTQKSQEKYMTLNLGELIEEIESSDFAESESLRDLLYGIVVQEKFTLMRSAFSLVEKFPQFFPFFADLLTKNVEHLPITTKNEMIEMFSDKLLDANFLPEFLRASLVGFVGSKEFFCRDTIMKYIGKQTRNEGTYIGRITFEAMQNLSARSDALEIREYFNRSNGWERRRIICLMKKLLPDPEYRAWRRSIRTYISKDNFARSI